MQWFDYCSLSKKVGHTQFGQWKIGELGHAVFDNADTVLWKKIRHRYDFTVERNSDYLNWRYRDQPWTKHYCLRVYDDAGQVAGLAVYRMAEETGLKAAIITELMGINDQDSSLFRTLLGVVERDVLRLGGTQIQVATSDPQIADAIGQSGYLKADLKPLVINCPNEMIGELNPQSTSMLTKGDQDWDQYPLADNFSSIDVIKKWRLIALDQIKEALCLHIPYLRNCKP